MESSRCDRPSRDAVDGTASRQAVIGMPATAATPATSPEGRLEMATKDKNTKKTTERKPPQKTLKEKRQARKAKK